VTRPIGVRWISSQPDSGYGHAAIGYLAALEALGIPVTWTPLIWRDGHSGAFLDYRGPLAHLAHRAIDYDTVVVHTPPGNHRRFLTGEGRRRAVLCTVWETDLPPVQWAESWSDFDVVLVPTRFNRDSLVATVPGVDVRVIPHCARQPGDVPPAPLARVGDRYVFYTIGTWSTRKAMPETVTAFLDAFTAADDVALVVKTGRLDAAVSRRIERAQPGGGANRWQATTARSLATVLAGRRDVPEIVLVPTHLADHAVDAIHRRGDCYFSLTRSEGWGLGVFDALLFGNPAVVTGWGGQLDYLGADYPLLVGYDLAPTSSDVEDDWFEARDDRFWARARHDDAVDVLRWVAAHREESAAIGAAQGARLAQEYAPDVVGRALLAALSTA